MNAWTDPHDPAIPEDAVRHCAAVFLISPLLCALILLTLLFVVQRSSRPLMLAVHLLFGLAMVAAACEPCVEILQLAAEEHAHESLSLLLPVTWSSAALASHLAACAGLLGLLLATVVTGKRGRSSDGARHQRPAPET